MLASLSNWIAKRREIRRRWRADAQVLILSDERNAYYAAQRFAARSRAQGNMSECLHWAKVAAEIARVSPLAEMDLAIVQTIVDEELARKPSSIS